MFFPATYGGCASPFLVFCWAQVEVEQVRQVHKVCQGDPCLQVPLGMGQRCRIAPLLSWVHIDAFLEVGVVVWEALLWKEGIAQGIHHGEKLVP